MPARVHAGSRVRVRVRAPRLRTARRLAALLAAASFAAGASRGVAEASSDPVICAAPAGPVALGSAQWNGWGHDPANTRYQPEPAIRAADVPKLALKWAFGYADSAVSGQPTIVDGRLFVTSATGRIYSLDARSGCTYWTYDAAAGVRTAISIGELAPPGRAVAPRRVPAPKKSKSKRTPAHLEVRKAPSAAFFGDERGAVYALDAERGTLLWKTQVDAHPLARIIAAPTLFEQRLYVAVASSEPSAAADPAYACCTFRGSVAALDIASGRIVWKTYTVSDEARTYGATKRGIAQWGPAGAPVVAAVTIDAGRGLLYAATGASSALEVPLADSVIALSLTDGALRWAKKLGAANGASGEFAASPVLRGLPTGRQMLFAGQRSGAIYSLDPDRNGEIDWQAQVMTDGKAGGGIEWGAAADHHSLYVALSGLAAEPPEMSGSLAAFDMRSGAKRWQTSAPAPACSWGPQSCAHGEAQGVTVIPGAAFSGSMDGHLRAYSTIDGKILWDYDTAHDFATVNGVNASGGSLDQGGATIVNGVLYVNSGYGQRAGQPGNVLLAFSVDGQ